jgi:hypothetical protein
MKKEDFVIGNWYNTDKMASRSIVRFYGFANGFFTYKEWVGGLTHRYTKSDGVFTNKVADWESYKKVSIEELINILPPDHESINEKVNFPKEGCCIYAHSIEKSLSELSFILNEGFCSLHMSWKEPYIFLQWSNSSYWILNTIPVNITQYSIGTLSSMINQIIPNKNEQVKTIKVQRVVIENNRRSIIGTIGIRNSRCEGAVGSRLEGNKTCVDRGHSYPVSIEIEPKAGLHKNT